MQCPLNLLYFTRMGGVRRSRKLNEFPGCIAEDDSAEVRATL